MNGKNVKGALVASAVCAMFATAAHAVRTRPRATTRPVAR